MTQTIRRSAVVPADRDTFDDLDGGLTVSPSDIGERLWHFFISMRTGLALILLLAILGLIGTLLIQAEPGLRDDPQAYAAWLESIRPRYGGWTGVLDALGLFSIFSSIWFRGTMALLTTSLLACSANRAPLLWRQALHPRTSMSEGFFAHAALGASITAPVAPQAALGEVVAAFRSRGFRTIVDEDGDQIHLYADRFRWGPFGTVIAHLSLLFILAGALVGTAWGFRHNGLAVPVGSRVEVGFDTGLSIEARSFSDSYYPNGSPSDYASDLVVFRDGAQVAAQTIRVNQPLRVGEVAIYQSFYGAAAVIHVADATGTVVFDQGVPLEWTSNDGNRRIGQMVLPDAGLTAYVIGPASGRVDSEIRPGQMQIEVYATGSEGSPVAIEVLSQGQPVSIAGLEFTFARERQFTGLVVAKDPGLILVWIGTALLVFGISLVFFFPHRRVWARIRRGSDGSTIQIGAIVRHDVTFRSDFQRLVDDLRLALNGPSAT